MKLLSNIKEISRFIYFSNVSKGIKPFLINEVYNICDYKKIIIVLDNNIEIEQFYNLFKNFFKIENVLKFPSWDNIPFEEISPSQPILNERFKSFNIIKKIKNNKEKYILFTNTEAFLQLVPHKSILEKNNFNLHTNQNISLEGNF